ncbi:MAG: (2Fe-2S)-binding protein [Sulfuricella sp.]|nr:(2Fe-2S)-binding protein [Sulfuricella sp.]
MYVCICQAVTDRQIREAICNGAISLGELRETLGIATQCGRCAEYAQCLLKETRSSDCEKEDFRQAA